MHNRCQQCPLISTNLDFDPLCYNTRAGSIYRATKTMALRSFFLFFLKRSIGLYRRRSGSPLWRREGGFMIPRLWNTFCTFRHDPHAIFVCSLFLFSILVYERMTFVQVRHSLYIILQRLGFRATFMSANTFVAALSLHGASCLRILSLFFLTILGFSFFLQFLFFFYNLQALTVPGSGNIVSISIRRSMGQVLPRGLGFYLHEAA
ncbi:hypothetical protein J3E69DRAFT_88508 [Trichoderma sp. SZMC 28015]